MPAQSGDFWQISFPPTDTTLNPACCAVSRISSALLLASGLTIASVRSSSVAMVVEGFRVMAHHAHFTTAAMRLAAALAALAAVACAFSGWFAAVRVCEFIDGW